MNNLNGFLVISALIAIFITGCGQAPHIKKLVVGYDTTGSDRAHLGAEVACFARETRDLYGVPMTSYRLDDRCVEILDGPAPGRGDDLLRILKRELSHPPLHRGTRPSAFWALAASDVASTDGPAVVILTGDADDDYQSPQEQRQIAASARRIAANPQSVVEFLGIAPDNRERARQLFSQLGERLILRGPAEVSPRAIDEAVSAASALHASAIYPSHS